VSALLPGPDYPAPAKINLFLHVVGRRGDGYHLLQTAYRFLDHGDGLRFRVRADGAIRRVSTLDGVAEEADLAVRAARLLKQATGARLGADIEIDKRLPLGGGLGGGSSDAATTLIALNHLWRTGRSREELMALGLALGADVPVFVYGRASFGEGIGERLQPVALAPAWYLVIVPPVAVPTAPVFAAPELTRNSKLIKLAAFSDGQVADFSSCRNDLQPVVEARYREVAQAVEWLGRHGQARMAGSGACVFAAFAGREEAERVMAQRPAGMNGFIARGIDRHPLWSMTM